MMLSPMARDVETSRNPNHVAPTVEQVEDALDRLEARRTAADAQMQADIEQLGRAAPAFGDQHLERRLDIADELARLGEAVGVEELHVVAVERVGQDQERR